MAKKKSKRSKSKKRSPAKSQLTHEVTIVPVKAEATVKSLSAAPGTTLGSLLKAAGIATERSDLRVDGKPATADTVLNANAKIEVSLRIAGS